MGSSARTDDCAFTKAAEHLGDRWSLLIVRELFMFGPQGFNQLATGLPGSISPIARGLLTWTAAVADGSVHLHGDPALVRELPTWFVESAESTTPQPAVAVA